MPPLDDFETAAARRNPKDTIGKLADLLERSGIDVADVARINRVNVWQAMSKDDNGDPVVTDLAGIQLVPNWADGPAWPVVGPGPRVAVKPAGAPRKPKRGQWRTAVVLPDIQIGYYRDGNDELQPTHDEAALAVARAVVRAADPDDLILLGDNLDFPELSKYRRHPAFQRTTQATIDRATLLAAELAKDAPNATRRAWLQGNHECLDTETRAVTERGFVAWDELVDGDRVLTVDDDGEAIYETVQAVHVYPFDGDLVHISTAKIDAALTPNHRVVGRVPSTGRWVERTAAGLLARPTTTKLVVAGTNGRADHPDVTDDELRLLAWCLTDSSQRASNVARISGLLDRLGLSYTTSTRDRVIDEIDGKPVRSHENEVVVNVTAEAGRDIPWPHHELPDVVWKLSARQVRLLLDEYQECDGTTPTGAVNSAVLYVSRERLREQLQLLAVTNGIAASATEYRPGHWRLNLDTRTTTKVFSATSAPRPYTKPYKGVVWCVTVPSGRFFVERHGRVHLTGNSRLPNYIVDNAVASFGLRQGNTPSSWPVLSIPHLCRLDETGWEYVSGYPAGTVWVNDRLRAVHGWRSKSRGSTAHEYLNSERVSTIYGHVHRREWAERTRATRDGSRTILAASPGCLARTDGVVPSVHGGYDERGQPVGAAEDWQSGLAVVQYQPGDGPFVYEQVSIFDGWAMWRGREFRA